MAQATGPRDSFFLNHPHLQMASHGDLSNDPSVRSATPQQAIPILLVKFHYLIDTL